MVFILIFSYLVKTGKLKRLKSLPGKIRLRIISPATLIIFGFFYPWLAIE